ncbi:MAG: flavodoxin family protein [Clostridiales bacterium]|nr:flavodoxin family protein [Clostridiales bacterium]
MSKVLIINGSTHENGTTAAALKIIAEELKTQGIDSEIVCLGTAAVHSCTGCMGCQKLGKCVFGDDPVNAIGEKAKEADGYIFAAPVHYASPAGAVIALLDRLFYSHGRYFKYKPAAAVVAARRAGTTASFDVLNKYIQISSMIQVPSTYWNMAFGANGDEVQKDEEGISVMRAIGSNMAWLLKLLENAKGTELEKPVIIKKARTNFIR